MNTSVCVIPRSFNFNLAQADIVSSLRSTSELIDRMGKGFVNFVKSSDFDEYAAKELFVQPASLDIGAIMGLLYDQQMSKVRTINLNENEVTQLVNSAIPAFDDSWFSLYSSDIAVTLTAEANRTIYTEKCLVNYCSEVLVYNPRQHKDYVADIQKIYRNLIFLDKPLKDKLFPFDSVRKIEGGYSRFIEGITTFLNYANGYTIIPNDSQQNLVNMNANLPFPVTPEGGGKNKRTLKGLKRDFIVDDIEYKDVNCEFHYKLERIDGANGKGTYYFNRIYFGFFNKIDSQPPKIAIAHIGEHL